MKILKIKSGILFSIVLSLTLGSANVEAQVREDGWEHLGSRKVNYALDKDIITVTAAEGTFTKLKLKVMGGSLNMHRMVVVYGNGTRDEIALRHNFSRRSGSRVIDLQGGKRIIKKVIFYYDSNNYSRGRAAIHLLGRH
jgi:hypothetical protein